MGMEDKEFFGVIPRERIKTTEVKRPPKDIIEEYLKLEDMAGVTARVLDKFGIVGGIGSVVLKPLIEGKRIVGPAITIRTVPSRISPLHGYGAGEASLLGGREAIFIGAPGDVVVIDSGGRTDASNMGGHAAYVAKTRGMAGSIVDGVVTGVPGIRKVDYPIWCRGGTTITGHYRVETIEINGIISCAGVQVQPGDLVVADDSGVTIVPSDKIEEVIELAPSTGRPPFRHYASISTIETVETKR